MSLLTFLIPQTHYYHEAFFLDLRSLWDRTKNLLVHHLSQRDNQKPPPTPTPHLPRILSHTSIFSASTFFPRLRKKSNSYFTARVETQPTHP